MGADLFESYVGGIIAAVTLANGDVALIMLPFYVAGAGIISAVVGYFAMGVNDDAGQKDRPVACQCHVPWFPSLRGPAPPLRPAVTLDRFARESR